MLEELYLCHIRFPKTNWQTCGGWPGGVRQWRGAKLNWHDKGANKGMPWLERISSEITAVRRDAPQLICPWPVLIKNLIICHYGPWTFWQWWVYEEMCPACCHAGLSADAGWRTGTQTIPTRGVRSRFISFTSNITHALHSIATVWTSVMCPSSWSSSDRISGISVSKDAFPHFPSHSTDRITLVVNMSNLSAVTMYGLNNGRIPGWVWR